MDDVRMLAAPSGTLVYFFCADPDRDPVASGVLAACIDLVRPTATGLTLDGWPVLQYDAGDDCRFVFVRTRNVLTHALDDYLPFIERQFADARALGVISWHGTAQAPDRILTVHTNGDASTGVFCPADPLITRAFVRALDRHRLQHGLHEWQVLLEGTHWSGSRHAHPAAWLARARTSLLDIEIGSNTGSWQDPAAAVVVARSLVRVFDDWQPRVTSLLGIGGMHCEPVFRDAVVSPGDPLFAVTHLLPNWCLKAGGYAEPSGLTRLWACVRTIRGGIHGILCHDSVKARVRSHAQRIADELQVPFWKHRAFRTRYLVPAAAAGPSRT